MKGLLGAVSLLTRVPVGTGAAAPGAVAGFVPWFPVVGAGVGLLVAAVYGGALVLLPPLPAAAVAVLAGVALTGAFHEDGLGDTADAFAGGWDREEVLRILKDPRLGTFGVVAVTASLLLRVAAVAALAPSAALAALPAAHALSRSAAVAVMAGFPPAAGEGLGASYARALSGRRALAGVAAGAGVGGLLLGGWALPAGALAALGGWLLGRLAVRRIGGVNGDLLGAVQQQAEMLVLLVAVAAGTWRSPVSSLIALVSGST
ncbi:MAG TPA: adenosylcobinamide-GDP ribazoletransferase [Actinomycetota bacterium]|jgi:adenosylcobinamide-GDP ribazoletransferase|nr:adenosylcobinamide-GDP ribazoletransferase [Actinomycetota bacterium]